MSVVTVQSLSCVSFATPWTHEPTRLLCPWDFPGKDNGVGCHFLLKGIFPTQGSNMCHLHWLTYFFTTKPPGKPRETLYRLKKKKNLLEFTCYSVVLLSVVEQSEYMCIYHLFVTIEHWVEFPVLYSSTFSLVIYLYPVAYICQSQSPNSSHSPFPSWCLYICFLHLCQFLLCR